MSATENEKKVRRRTVHWISSANKPKIPLETRLKGGREGKVGLFYPDAAIDDALALEPTKLKRDVRHELHDHVRTSSDACKVFEVLAHEAVSRSRVSEIYDALLLASCACRIETLLCKQSVTNLLIPCDIFGPQKSK